ncbi:hypothetical protein CIK05_10925 [Bdellovibrio sp. qaytius]|nr:hypothetical protein CIK05_10925 [Bdellovibrio sp. qaytius]
MKKTIIALILGLSVSAFSKETRDAGFFIENQIARREAAKEVSKQPVQESPHCYQKDESTKGC